MSRTSSTAKNNQINLRNHRSNKGYKTAIKKATKRYLLSVKDGSSESIQNCLENLSLVYQKIDKAVKRKVLHKNTAARKKSRLARIINVKIF
uniref:Small ribosomal subunit protein bS20c n=1 Tax=Dasyclonium flaccidum TaxID=2007274 RepID=A0A1Z1MKL4_9FLOR|nr:ribosomal protein S20 [Dasyclonium flaccidum]ARW66627.1 ribosomal protein S20 [Dasyclonium flaccidum]